MSKSCIISDESVNSYGFYLLNKGADVSEFKKNPILLWMHQRAFRGTKDDVLPLGTIENIRFNQVKQRWEGDPVFDLEDQFAAEIARKWEAGILRMVSAGIEVTGVSNDLKYLKEGQTRETVTGWKLKEVSIVDIGSNKNALAFYNNDELISLSDNADQDIPIRKLNNNLNNQNEMAEMIKLADGRELSVEQVQALVERAASQEQAIQALTTERDQLKGKVAGLELAEKEARKTEAEQLVNDAVRDGRIDATPDKNGKSAKDLWLNFFEKDHESSKAALSAIPKRTSVTGLIHSGKEQDGGEAANLQKLSWDELDKAGKLALMKDKYPDIYEQKFEARFGCKPRK